VKVWADNVGAEPACDKEQCGVATCGHAASRGWGRDQSCGVHHLVTCAMPCCVAPCLDLLAEPLCCNETGKSCTDLCVALLCCSRP
jgi:hypothetical protein